VIGKASEWVTGHRAEIALSLRITAAGLIAFALGELLGVQQVYWAVLTTVIVMQASVGGSLKATLDRLVGTAAGGLWGAAVAGAMPHDTVVGTAGALAAALVPLALLVAWWPSYRVAPVTAIIVLLVPHGEATPLDAAVERLIEIALGCAVALGVALAVTPSRAHRLLYTAAGDALAPVRELIALLLAGAAAPVDAAAVLVLHDRIRATVERCAAAAGDAARERASYLSDAPDPDPLVRSLRRISHDLVMLARALPTPLPEPVRGRLAKPAQRAAAALDAFLAGLAEALKQGAASPSLEPVKQSVADYEAAIAAIRRDGLIVPLPAEDAERIFGVAFALQQLLGNIEDLANRATEVARPSASVKAITSGTQGKRAD